MLTIRRYQPEDHEAVVSLHLRALRAVGADRHCPDEDLDDIEGVYIAAGGDFLVGLEDGRLVAMGGLMPMSEGRAMLRRLRVEPDRQGRGYGRAMLRARIERARDLGFTTLELDTTSVQLAALALFRAEGFTEVGRSAPDDMGRTTVYFERPL